MHADFTHNPQTIPDLVRRIESGADLVVAEGRLEGETSRARALVRRHAPALLRGVVTVPGVQDLVSGFAAIRLVALRNAIRSQSERLLVTDGWAANAELYWRAGRYSRRIEAVTVASSGTISGAGRRAPSRGRPLARAVGRAPDPPGLARAAGGARALAAARGRGRGGSS